MSQQSKTRDKERGKWKGKGEIKEWVTEGLCFREQACSFKHWPTTRGLVRVLKARRERRHTNGYESIRSTMQIHFVSTSTSRSARRTRPVITGKCSPHLFFPLFAVVASAAVACFSRFPERRPTELTLALDGSVSVEDLFRLWSRHQGFPKTELPISPEKMHRCLGTPSALALLPQLGTHLSERWTEPPQPTFAQPFACHGRLLAHTCALDCGAPTPPSPHAEVALTTPTRSTDHACSCCTPQWGYCHSRCS